MELFSAFAGPVLVLVVLVLILALVLGGGRRRPRARIAQARGSGTLMLLAGVTVSVASLDVARQLLPGSSQGAQGVVAIGGAVGGVYGCLAVLAPSFSVVDRVVRPVLQAVVGIPAAAVGLTSFLATSTACSAASTPAWVPVAALVLATVVSVLLVVRAVLALPRRPFEVFDTALAAYGVVELLLFFTLPFGLAATSLGVPGVVTAVIGVAAVLVSAAISVEVVIATAGAVLFAVVLVVDLLVGTDCRASGGDGAAVVVSYGLAFLLLRSVVRIRSGV